MSHRIRASLSTANVLSTLALFISLGSGAYAAGVLPANSVGSKQLKRNAVTATKIAKGAVGADAIAAQSLSAIDFAPGQLPTGPQGPAGPSGPAGPASSPILDYEQGTASVPDGGAATPGQVSCPPGQNVVSGGAYVESPEAGTGVAESYPDGRTGWIAHGINQSGDGAKNLTVYAICTSAGATKP